VLCEARTRVHRGFDLQAWRGADRATLMPDGAHYTLNSIKYCKGLVMWRQLHHAWY